MNNLYGEDILKDWRQLRRIIELNSEISLQGDSLTIPILYAASLFHSKPSIDKSLATRSKVAASVRFVHDQLQNGKSIYGVNTGFGGSANVHTTDTQSLQVALVQMQLSGILPTSTEFSASSTASASPDSIEIHKLAVPEAWIRGAILVRCNSLLRGHSAVRIEIMQALVDLLRKNLIPLVPLRGSISASGDLCPLSYIAGVLEGNPDVKVWSGNRNARHLVPANVSLIQEGMNPIRFGPKEILGLINGTAVSVAVASIAQHEADILMILAQVLTAMGVEATTGSKDDFDPFFGAVRPHAGQIEIAANINSFLKNSGLATSTDEEKPTESRLRQNRYALRTVAQWLGPFLEDMRLAREQLKIELNSTTDNPLIDVDSSRVHHGGNFQATAVTTATEKVRSALEKVGKMIFAQSTELLDYKFTYNLPPNLSVDEPSLSFSMKGIDINVAAYMSELSFLANPVSSHVLSAEMGNQAINSLAFISARYTHMAVDLVSLMSSAYLYTICHALDLRAMHLKFLAQLEPAMDILTKSIFSGYLDCRQVYSLQQTILQALIAQLAATTSMDSSERFVAITRALQPHLTDALQSLDQDHQILQKPMLEPILEWSRQAAEVTKKIFCTNREEYLAHPDATEYLGAASRRMYNFVRNELKVPMHRGLIDHPKLPDGGLDPAKKNTGTQISIIYRALRDGRLSTPIMECLGEAIEDTKKTRKTTCKL